VKIQQSENQHEIIQKKEKKWSKKTAQTIWNLLKMMILAEISI
jgi:hypothetical protein